MDQVNFQSEIRDMMEVWNLEHREAQHSQRSLDVLAAKYSADLIDEGVTPGELFAACKRAGRRWEFFPKMADILRAVDEYRAKPPTTNSDHLQISDSTSNHDLTPEELRRNKERVRLITAALAGRMSFDDAEIAVSRMGPVDKHAGGAAR